MTKFYVMPQTIQAVRASKTDGGDASERNKQLAQRMRDALASNQAAYKSLKQDTLLFRDSTHHIIYSSCARLVSRGVKSTMCRHTTLLSKAPPSRSKVGYERGDVQSPVQQPRTSGLSQTAHTSANKMLVICRQQGLFLQARRYVSWRFAAAFRAGAEC